MNCESVPGKTGSLSVSSYSSHSMMAIHYVPLDPCPETLVPRDPPFYDGNSLCPPGALGSFSKRFRMTSRLSLISAALT